LTLKQVQAVKSFTHRGAYVAVGDVCLVSPVRAKLYERKGYVTRDIKPVSVAQQFVALFEPGPFVTEVTHAEEHAAEELVEVAVPVRRRRSYRRRDMTAETE
jgi:hypothetical protein